MPEMIKVLAVDDDPAVIGAVQDFFRGKNIEIIIAPSYSIALREFRAAPHRFHCIVVDSVGTETEIRMFLEQVRLVDKSIGVLFYSGAIPSTFATKDLGILAAVDKGQDLEHLYLHIKEAKQFSEAGVDAVRAEHDFQECIRALKEYNETYSNKVL